MSEEVEREHAVPGGVFHYREGNFPSDPKIRPTRGKGCYLWTESGEKYLDYLLGSGPLIAGHAHSHVVEAIQERAERSTTFYVTDRSALDLANRIVDAVPCADLLKFTSTGSEATYVALRLARACTGNEKILKFRGAYHGFHDYVLRSSDKLDPQVVLDAGYPEGTVDSAGVVSSAADSTVIAPFNDLHATRDIISSYSDELAGVILEPVMRALPAEEEFLAGLRDICDEEGIVLIFDEVATGFRLALGGAQEFYGVEPDLATYGKAIGGGTPLGALAGSEEIMSLSNPEVPIHEGGTYVSGTLSGNPLCAAAGHATLDVLERDGTYDHLNEYGEDFRSIIDELLADSSLSGTSMGVGPFVDYLITDATDVTRWETIVHSNGETKREIDLELLDRGLLQHVGGKRYISTEHGNEELDLTEEAYKEAIDRVQ